MKKAVIVFRSKTDVFGFIEALAEKNVPAAITGTPKEAHIGCGIAIEIDVRFVPAAKALVRGGKFKSFYGIFLIERVGSRSSTVALG